MPRRIFRRTKSIMMLAFAVIVICVAILGLVEYAQERQTRNAIAGIEQNALVSVELVHRIGDDIQREQLLLDAHVIEHDQSSMQRIENKIARLRADYEDAARSYESLPAPPVEVIAWRQLTSEVAASRVMTAPVMKLSREDRTAEAAHTLNDLEPSFERIAKNEAELDHINNAEADVAVAEVRRVQKTALDLRLALLGVVLVTVVVVGRWTGRSALNAQETLANLNEALAQRNRDLDAFAGRLAHDVRGPLGTIRLSASTLADRFPDARRTTAIMDRSIAQITNLMDELLTLSRLGTMPKATAHAESVANALEQRLEPLIREVGGTLRIDLQPGLIACSENLLSQVLWNLAENSVKYRRSDVPVAISIEGREEGGRYRILASDNGMGMTETDARRAFEPFYRGKHSKIAGTGLGLAIVRRVIEATHGTISVESHLGEGTTFTLSIPLGTPDTSVAAGHVHGEPVPAT